MLLIHDKIKAVIFKVKNEVSSMIQMEIPLNCDRRSMRLLDAVEIQWKNLIHGSIRVMRTKKTIEGVVGYYVNFSMT